MLLYYYSISQINSYQSMFLKFIYKYFSLKTYFFRKQNMNWIRISQRMNIIFLIIFFFNRTNQAPTYEQDVISVKTLYKQISSLIENYDQTKNRNIGGLLSEKVKLLQKINIPQRYRQKVNDILSVAEQILYQLSLPTKKKSSLFRRRSEEESSDQQITLLTRSNDEDQSFDQQGLTMLAPPQSSKFPIRKPSSSQAFRQTREEQTIIEETINSLSALLHQVQHFIERSLSNNLLRRSQYESIERLLNEKQREILFLRNKKHNKNNQKLNNGLGQIEKIRETLEYLQNLPQTETKTPQRKILIPPAPNKPSKMLQIDDFKQDSLHDYTTNKQKQIKIQALRILHKFKQTNKARQLILKCQKKLLKYTQRSQTNQQYDRNIADLIFELKQSHGKLQKEFDYLYASLSQQTFSNINMQWFMIKLQQNFDLRSYIDTLLSKYDDFVAHFIMNPYPPFKFHIPNRPSQNFDVHQLMRKQKQKAQRKKTNSLQEQINKQFHYAANFKKTFLQFQNDFNQLAVQQNKIQRNKLLQKFYFTYAKFKKQKILLDSQFNREKYILQKSVLQKTEHQKTINKKIKKLQQNLDLRTVSDQFVQQYKSQLKRYQKEATQYLLINKAYSKQMKRINKSISVPTKLTVQEKITSSYYKRFWPYTDNKQQYLIQIYKVLKSRFYQTERYTQLFVLLLKNLQIIKTNAIQQERSRNIYMIYMRIKQIKNYQQVLTNQFEDNKKFLGQPSYQIVANLIKQKLQQNLNLRHQIQYFIKDNTALLNCIEMQTELFILPDKDKEIQYYTNDFKVLPPPPIIPNQNVNFLKKSCALERFVQSSSKIRVQGMFQFSNKYYQSFQAILRSIKMLSQVQTNQQSIILLKNILTRYPIVSQCLPKLNDFFNYIYQKLKTKNEGPLFTDMIISKLQQITDLKGAIQNFILRNGETIMQYQRQLRISKESKKQKIELELNLHI